MVGPYNNFCNCRCPPPVQVLVDWNRHMLNADPVAGDTTVTGYTTDWTFGYNVLYQTVSVWRCMIFGTTPDDTPVGTRGHWNRKMRPMRFSLASEGSLFAVHRLISETAIPAFGSAILTQPTFYPPPASDVGPPLGGHFAGSETRTFSVSLPFSTPFRASATARYMRLWVNGVDQTGPVSINVSGTNQQGSNAYYNFDVSGITTSSPVDVTDKSIDVDIWIEVDVTVPGASIWDDGYNYFPAVWAYEGTIGGRYSNATEHYMHFIRGINGLNVNALNATTLDYEFTFSSAISGGTTSATTVTASPWTVTRTNRYVTLTHNTLPNDTVVLYYGQEIVEIIITQLQTHTPFNTLVWYYRYVPATTGNYDLDDLVQPGVFDPSALQTFNLIGFTTSNGATYNTDTSLVAGWCPTTITVEPYP